MGQPTVSVVRLQEVPEKADGHPPGSLCMSRGQPAAARAKNLYMFWFPAGGPAPWGTAPTQRLSRNRRFYFGRSARGCLWREGRKADMLGYMFAGMEVNYWDISWMG